MSTRLEQFTERRRRLQLRCAVQRGEIDELQAGIDASVARADRVIIVARRLTPWLLVAGGVAVVAMGPARALGLVRQGLTVALFANRAVRLLR